MNTALIWWLLASNDQIFAISLGLFTEGMENEHLAREEGKGKQKESLFVNFQEKWH